MYLPILGYVRTNNEMTDAFYGYSARLREGSGWFSGTKNLTADNFPVMSERDKRTHIRNIGKANGMYASDGIAWCDGTDLYYNGLKVEDEDLILTDSAKTFVRMAAWLCIFPDKVMYNVKDGTVKYMENEYKSVGTVRLTPCTYDGTAITPSTTEPGSPSDGDYWLKDGKELYRWSGAYGQWQPVATSYIKVEELINYQTNTDFAKGFAENDTVNIKIKNCPDAWKKYEGDWIIYRKDDDSCFIIAGLTETVLIDSELNEVTISRTVPDLEYVCENANRLWGCSSVNHEIYACALGDPTNWNNLHDPDYGSCAFSIGSAGDFTGCVSYRGYVLFFKEQCIHRVYGNSPSNYQLMDISCRGVEKGSEKSIAEINEMLYYKARDCVCAFDGSISGSISDALGSAVYHDAVAGSFRDTYMISMRDKEGMRQTFTYDTERNIWIHEDAEEIVAFANDCGALYYMTEDEIRLVQKEYGTDLLFPSMGIMVEEEEEEETVYAYTDSLYPGTENFEGEGLYPGHVPRGAVEGDVEWMAETHDIGMEYTGAKYVSRIVLRLSCEKEFNMDIMYDSDGIWENVLSIYGTGKRSVTVPVRLRRCDHCRLKIYGTGGVKLYSMAKTIEQGLTS